MNITTHQEQGGRDYQEDRYLVAENFGGAKNLILCLVCDGHGGSATSSFLVKEYPNSLLEALKFVKRAKKQHADCQICRQRKLGQPQKEQCKLLKKTKILYALGRALNQCIIQWDKHCLGDQYDFVVDKSTRKQFFDSINEAKYAREGKTAGSTFVGMLINLANSKAYVINIGDSRCVWKSESGSISQTVDDNVFKTPTSEQKANAECSSAKDMYDSDTEEHKCFTFKTIDGRIEGDLAMRACVGDDTRELYGAVRRTFHTDKISFKNQPSFRAVIASDGLWDIAKNQQVLYEPFENASAIADFTKELMIEAEAEKQAELLEAEEKRQAELLKQNPKHKWKREDFPAANWKREDFVPVFPDNVTIIYIKLSSDKKVIDLMTQVSKLEKDLKTLKLEQKQQLVHTKTMKASKNANLSKSASTTNAGTARKQSRQKQQEPLQTFTHQGVTVRFARKQSRK